MMSDRRAGLWLFGVVLIMASGCTGAQPPRPNILLVVADDLGFTDLGSFGGEIHTPNLDALAEAGVRLTQFYTAPTCSPTRAMLMSGTDNHLAGLGNMFESLRPNQRGQPGYEGSLSTRVAALPELLRDAGYHTYMAGKWHLGLTEETSPASRGFERSFALAQGGAGHFSALPLVGPNPPTYREDGKLVELPADFYSSRTYAERLVEYIETRPDDGQPFFAYLAFTAPHWPLQAPVESIAKYAGRYDAGYDALQASRFARMRELGLVTPGMQTTPRPAGELAWEALSDEDRRVAARTMEIYAAMVDDLDRYLGTVLDALRRRGEFDNTFIFFMSDNGAEGGRLDLYGDIAAWVTECCDNSFENMGGANSYLWYGPNWARAGAAPFRRAKGFTNEGGIRAPAIVHYPGAIPGGIVHNTTTTVMDVLPTILEIADIEHPATFRGRNILPLRGASLMPVLTGANTRVHADDVVLGWELFGRRAIRRGDWKIVWEASGASEGYMRDPDSVRDGWRLYDVARDPGERHDVAGEHPDVLRTLVAEWEAYARETGVVLPDYSEGPGSTKGQ